MFAESYIQNNVVYPPLTETQVSPALSVVVVIPCLNEPEIIRTLDSLWAGVKVEAICEVIVLINDSEISAAEVKALNSKTLFDLMAWKQRNDRPGLSLLPVYVPSVKAKFAGAGMARKIGMDEAVRRLNTNGKSDGVIVSLDSDCLVSANYLQRICDTFQQKSCFAATINFSHRVDELDDVRQKRGMQLYEDYLHYYKQALEFIGFPSSIYTIGSAFAVRAGTYAKQGGMNRRQAGEDFYFLSKLSKLGRVTEISDAYVYPSGRVSDRVPFGTGAALTKWMNGTADLTLTYHFSAFLDLKKLFDRVDLLYQANEVLYVKLLADLPSSVQEYLTAHSFQEKISEINANSSSAEAFRKRFFNVFDAFQILKFLNLSHEKTYAPQELREAIDCLNRAKIINS